MHVALGALTESVIVSEIALQFESNAPLPSENGPVGWA
jgi:hypothetical protein